MNGSVPDNGSYDNINNRVTIRLNEDQLDDIMQHANNNRELIKSMNVGIKDTNVYGNLVITDILNSEYVVNNQKNLNYATEFVLQLPFGGDVTPMELNGILVDALINGEVHNQFFRFGGNEWQGVQPHRTFNATKHLRDGSTTPTTVAEISIDAKKYMTLFKLSATNPNGYDFCTIYNPYDETKTFVIELPQLLDERGWSNWIKAIYKGAMFIGDVASYLSYIPGPVGWISTAVTNLADTVAAVTAPSVILDDVGIRSVKQEKLNATRNTTTTTTPYVGPVFDYDRGELTTRDGLRDGDIYEITDEDMATFNADLFNPVLAQQSN